MIDSSALAGHRLLILDGTRIACEIVRQAQRMGIHAVVADYNEPSKAPAKRIADEHHLVSITDVDAVVDLIRRERIDGVVAGFSDKMLPYYAEICERASLPCYGSRELFTIFTDKDAYKNLCERFGVPTISGYSLSDFTPESTTQVRYPVIVKPSRGSGSKGVKVCRNADEVLQFTAGAAGHGEDFIVEQYLTGDEATVFWVFQNGEHHVSGIANRHVVRFDSNLAPLPYAYTMPSHIAPSYLEDIAPRGREMFAEVGVENGMMFMQGIIDDGVFRMYDIGYRVTGTQEYRLFEEISGYNPLEMMIGFALTGRGLEDGLAEKISRSPDLLGFNISVLMEPGTIGTIDGLSEVEALPGVVAVLSTRDPGDSLPAEAAGELRQITVRILGTARSADEMGELMLRIRQTVRVVGPDGSDLTLRTPPIIDLPTQLART